MNTKTTIDVSKKPRTHIITGEIKSEDLLDFLQKMYSDSSLDSSLNSLWDLRNTTGIEKFRTEDISMLVDLVGNKWQSEEKIKSALVVSKDIEFGLGRMYELQLEAASKNEVRVFRDMEKALEWLS